MTSWTNVHINDDENDYTSSYTEVHWSLTDDIEFNYRCLGVNDAEKHDEECLYQLLSNEELIIQGIPINYYNGDNGSIVPQFDMDEILCLDQQPSNYYSSTRHWQQLEINDIKLKKKDTGYTKHQGSSRKRFVSRFQDSRWSDQMGQQQSNKKVFYCLKSLHSNLKVNDCDNKIMQRIARNEMMVETQILLNLCSKSSSSHPNIIQIYGMKVMMESPEESFIITDCIHELLSDRIDRWERLISDDNNYDDVGTKGTKTKILPNDPSNVSLLSQRLEMALEIASALAFLHDRNMIYFLRPESIGFDTRYDRLKLCQLGQVCKSDGFSPDDKITSNEMINYYYYNRITNVNSSNFENKNLIYTPPELLLRQANAVTTAVDVYSFGILLWRMITLKQPYYTPILQQEFSKFVHSICKNHERPCLQEIDVVIKNNESHTIQNLLQECWDPYKRPNMHIVIEQIGQFLLFQDDSNDNKNNVEVEAKKDEKLMTNSKEREKLKRESSPLRENHKTSSQSKVHRHMSDDIVTLSVLRQKVKLETEDEKVTSSPSKKKIRVVTRRSKSSDSKDVMTLQQLQIADDHEKFKQKLVRNGSFRRQEEKSERKVSRTSSKPVDNSYTQAEVEPSSPSGKKTSKRVGVDSSKDAPLTSPLANKTDRKSDNTESPKKSKVDRRGSLRRKEYAAELIANISSNPMDSSAAMQGEFEPSSPSGKKTSKRVDVDSSKDALFTDHKTNNTDSPKKTKHVRKSSFRRQEDVSSKPIEISAIRREFEPSSPSGNKVSKRVGTEDTLLISSSANKTDDHKTSNTDSLKKTKEKSDIRIDTKVLEENSRNENGKSRSRPSSGIKSRNSLSPVRSKQDNRSESRSPKTSPNTSSKLITVDATDADGEKPRKSKQENGKVVKSRSKGESSPLSSPVVSPTISKVLYETGAGLPSKASTTKNVNGDRVRPETRTERCRSCSQERSKSKSTENIRKRSESRSSSPVNVKERIFQKLNTLVSEDEKGKKDRSDTTIESSMHSSFIREQNIVYAAMKELVNQEICNLIRELEESRIKEPKESRTKSRQPNSDYSEYKPQDVTDDILPSSQLKKNPDDVRDSLERSPKQTKRQTARITSPRGTDKHRSKQDPGSPKANPQRRSSSTESPRRKTQHRINIQQLAAESPSRLRRTKVSDSFSPNENAVSLDRNKTPFKQPESPTKSPSRVTSSHQVMESLNFGSPGTKQKNTASDASIFVTRRVRRNSSLTNFDHGRGEFERRQSEEQVETFKFHNSFGWEKQENDYFASNDDFVSPSTNRLSSNRVTSTSSATLRVVHQRSPTSRRGSMDSAMFSQKASASRSSLYQTSGMGNGERVAGSVKRTRLASAREVRAGFSYFPEATQSKKASAENEAMRKLQVNLEMASPITPTTSPKKTNSSKKRVDLMSPAKLFLSSGYAAASESIDFEAEADDDKAIWEHLVRDRRKSFIQAVYAEGQPTTKMTNAAHGIGHTDEKKFGNRFSRRASTNF